MKLTKEQAVEEHRKMWNWIAEETEKRRAVITKEDYLREFYPDEEIKNVCFCCQYACQLADLVLCDYCPIDWANEEGCLWYGSAYEKWRRSKHMGNWRQAAAFAREIAELPERDVQEDKQ